MSITVKCACGSNLTAPDGMAGKKSKCPKCQAIILIPEQLDLLLQDEVPLPKSKSGRPETKAERIEQYNPVAPENSDAPEQTALDRQLSVDTHASNPGNVKVDFLFTFINYPMGTLFMVAMGAVFLGLAAWNLLGPQAGKNGMGFLAVAIATWGTCAWAWHVFSRTMIYGCANPGVIVDSNKGLVAVITDLDCGIGEEYWIIKIIKAPLRGMTGGPPEDGARVGTVAGYSGDPSRGHWDSFEPFPVNCITRDNKRVGKVMATFSDRDWALLEEGLKEVPTPYKEGQWRVLEDLNAE